MFSWYRFIAESVLDSRVMEVHGLIDYTVFDTKYEFIVGHGCCGI